MELIFFFKKKQIGGKTVSELKEGLTKGVEIERGAEFLLKALNERGLLEPKH